MDMAGSESLSNDERGDAVMSFVMPSKYTKESLPKPNNPDVKIVEVPSHLAAALTFRGHIRCVCGVCVLVIGIVCMYVCVRAGQRGGRLWQLTMWGCCGVCRVVDARLNSCQHTTSLQLIVSPAVLLLHLPHSLHFPLHWQGPHHRPAEEAGAVGLDTC